MKKIRGLCAQIARRFQPQKIILFARRTGVQGDLCSFKLCVVAAVEDKRRAMRDIYLETDCDIPFDVLLYSPGEWASLSRDPDSFAGVIASTGRVLYG